MVNIIFGDETLCWHIYGNTGIGKTLFGYYILYLIAQKGESVIYYKVAKPPIFFDKKGTVPPKIISTDSQIT